MHRCRSWAALVVGGVLAFSACGGGGGGSAKSGGSQATRTGAAAGSGATSTPVDVAAQYQAAVRTADAATCTFNKAVGALGPDPQVRETRNLVPPVARALRTFRRQLGDIPWPAAARADAVKLQQATDAIVSDIEALPDQSPSSMGSWTTKTQQDKATFAGATRALRARIGLLPLATQTCA